MITASDKRQRGFLQRRRWLDACCCCLPSGFFGVLVLDKESLDCKGLKTKDLVKGWGHPRFYLWGWQRDRGRRLWCIPREIWKVERFP
jgi:hypothetical protein